MSNTHQRRHYQNHRARLNEQKSILTVREFAHCPALISRQDLKYVPALFLMTYYPDLIPRLWHKLPFNVQQDNSIKMYLLCQKHEHSADTSILNCHECTIGIASPAIISDPVSTDNQHSTPTLQALIDEAVSPTF